MGTIKRCLESARRRRLSRLRLKRCKRDLRLADGDVISLVGNDLGEGVAHRNAIHLSSSAAARPLSIASAARSAPPCHVPAARSEEHTSELQSLMRISYAVFCLKKKKKRHNI